MGDYHSFSNDAIIQSFYQITLDLKISIILNLTVSQNSERRGGSKKPLLRDFNWARNIVNLSYQIYSIYRPSYYGITEDENGNSLENIIEITCLKDLKNELQLLRIDHSKERIL